MEIAMPFKLLGITEEFSTCDCCGKKNLKCTVALENEEGDIVYYGRDCAGAALYGRKDRKNGILAEERARMVQKCQNVKGVALAAYYEGGKEAAEKAARKVDGRFSVSAGYYTDTGNKMSFRIYWNGYCIPGVEIPATDY
jgi:hypothetical protein